MRRALVAAVVALALLAVLPAAAAAHPLGNFSVNHLAEVSISADAVEVRYLLDEAEIPTFQQRGVAAAELLRRKRAEAERRLVLTVDGRRVPLRLAGRPLLTHPPGSGGLRTTRVELPLAAKVRDPRRVGLRDGTFPGRVGWRAIVARPGRATAVRSSAPSGDPTAGLRRYPEDLLESPADVRAATFTVAPGAGTLDAPDAREGGAAEGEDPLTAAFTAAAAGESTLVLLLLAAFAWGALHALSPGHGKAMVAAYLVGVRGTARHAVALGATVTIAHTAGVFALGGVAVGLSAYVLPEDLYPWLSLVSGLLVLGVGAAVLRGRLRHRHHHHHGHHHHHHHDQPERLSWRSLIALGGSAGLIPCPSALVVLLAALTQGQVALACC